MPSVFTYLLHMHPSEHVNHEGFLDDMYGRGTRQNASDQALCCKAVFQSLKSVSQQYIMRLLWLGGDRPFPIKILEDFVYPDPEFVRGHITALRELMR
jgi:hypothetical protein